MASYCCSQCSFAAQFESALNMHRQLHHDSTKVSSVIKNKSNTVPRVHPATLKNNGFKLPVSSSATRLFDRLRAKVCKSRQSLFIHNEGGAPPETIVHLEPPLSVISECSSKALSPELIKKTSPRVAKKESYGCHLCPFDTDRITVLDRHLLNDHKIGLERLLKLVLAKTKEGLSEEPDTDMFNSRQSYYKPCDEEVPDVGPGKDFVVETSYPKITIYRHAAVVTDLKLDDVIDRRDLCECDSGLEKTKEVLDEEDLVSKISTLNDCMCKFVDSSNTLKRVLAKELDSKHSIRTQQTADAPMFHLKLGCDTPREYRRTQSDKADKNCCKNCRSGRSTFVSDSIYF